jgi:hypothetical protein
MDEATARYLKELADALLQTARIQHEMQQEFGFLQGIAPAPSDKKPRRPMTSHRGPSNPRHQTFRGFALDMQQCEAKATREHLRLSKKNVAQFGVVSDKTVVRTMEWYGLAPTAWPPSTWDPNESREGGAGTKNS